MSCSPPLASFPISSVAVFTADVNIAFACFSVLDLVLLPIVGSSSELYVYWGALGWDGAGAGCFVTVLVDALRVMSPAAL